MGPEGRVLVVDDEPAIRALIAKIVERAGFPVDSARDGAEAMERLGSMRGEAEQAEPGDVLQFPRGNVC